jgi:hypothetical protein
VLLTPLLTRNTTGDTPPARGVSFARPTAGRRRSQDLQLPMPLAGGEGDALGPGLLPLPSLEDGPGSDEYKRGGGGAGLEGTSRAPSAREVGSSRQRSFILNGGWRTALRIV